MEFRVDYVPSSATWELRHTVLRPHESIDELALPANNEPACASFAAIGIDGEILGTAQLVLAPPPFPLEDHTLAGSSWRLRGMATREDVRNVGIGSEVLRTVIRHAKENDGGLIWCNARVPAMNFYEQAGFVAHGEIWQEPDIGPHIVMWRLI